MYYVLGFRYLNTYTWTAGSRVWHMAGTCPRLRNVTKMRMAQYWDGIWMFLCLKSRYNVPITGIIEQAQVTL